MAAEESGVGSGAVEGAVLDARDEGSLDPRLDSADVLAARGYGDVDWYRWQDGGFISPVAEMEVAAVEIARALLPLCWIR